MAACAIGTDKYFHCNAAVDGDYQTAGLIGAAREWTDQHIKGGLASA